MQIQRQVDVLPGHRRHLFQQAHHPPVGIHLDLLISGGTVQRFLVVAFDTLLADIMVGGVVLLFPRFGQLLQIAVVDFRYVANHVRQFGPVGVCALLVALHRDAGEMKLIDRKTRHFNIAQVRF